MAAVTLSSLFGSFKTQAFNRQAMMGSMDRWAGRTAQHAMNQTATQMRIMKGIRGSSGNMAAARFALGSARPGMMRGAMWGAGMGAAGAVGNDAMNNNLGFGTVGRAIGGGFRGGLMGGAFGGLGGGIMGRRSSQRIYRNMR